MHRTVSFHGKCGARSVVTLVSQLITHPYRVTKLRAKFANGCENLLRLEFIVASDADAPATGRPNGMSLLMDYGQIRYLVGNDEVVELDHEVEMLEGNSYVKIYADNRDYYEHDVLVQMTIMLLERR